MKKKSELQLKGIPKILDLSFTSNLNFVKETKSQVNIEIDFSTKYELNDTKTEMIVFLTLNLNEKTESVTPFKLQTTILGLFEIAEDSKNINSFHKLAPSILLSYMRPIISNITTYAGLPPYIIPFLDLSSSK